MKTQFCYYLCLIWKSSILPLVNASLCTTSIFIRKIILQFIPQTQCTLSLFNITDENIILSVRLPFDQKMSSLEMLKKEKVKLIKTMIGKKMLFRRRFFFLSSWLSSRCSACCVCLTCNKLKKIISFCSTHKYISHTLHIIPYYFLLHISFNRKFKE